MNKPLLIAISIFFSLTACWAQDSLSNVMILSYNNVIEMARDQSPAALSTKTRKKNKYWEWKAFNAEYLPQIVLESNIPDIRKRFEPNLRDDGTINYTSIFNSTSDVGIAAQQLVGLTGGRFYIDSDLNAIYDFNADSLGFQYRYNPVSIGFIQPIFKFNTHRWDRKIEDMKYRESEKQFFIDMEQISLTATRYFFNLMISQIDYEIAELNLNNNDTIYKIARGRYNLGKIAENEYLQIELQYIQSQQQLEQAKIDIQNSQLALKNYLGVKSNKEIVLLLPELLFNFNVDVAMALDKAKQHRPEILLYQRQLLEAEKQLRKAESNSGLNADLSVEYGLTSVASDLNNLYGDVGNKQALNVYLRIPIIDWGRSKSQINQASANLELVEYNLAQEEVTFDQEVITHVNSFLQSIKQVEIAKRANVIADKRFEVAKNRYMIGNITITDINIATQERDKARKSYISALRTYWLAYYELRRLTLYDFQFNRDILQAS